MTSRVSEPLSGRPAARGAQEQLLAFLKLFGGLLALVVVGIVVSPRVHGKLLFLDQTNLFDILARVSKTGILAVGMTVVILTAGIDLSVGSILSLGSVVTAMLLLERGWNPGSTVASLCFALSLGVIGALAAARLTPRAAPGPRAWAGLGSFVLGGVIGGGWAMLAVPHGVPILGLLLMVVSVGLVVGCLNGVLIAYGGLQPFIATLATMISVWGVAWLVPGESNARRSISTTHGGPLVDAFNVLGSRLGNAVPVAGIFFLACVLLGHWLVRYAQLGRQIYAIGGNEDAARLSGIPVAGTKVLVYGLSGALAALTGLLWSAQYHQGFPDAGQGAELDAIAAVVIGGTSLMGGRGSVAGTLMGVLMFGVLNNILNLLQYSTNWQRVVTGAIIAVAVLFQEGQLRALARQFFRNLRGGSKHAS